MIPKGELEEIYVNLIKLKVQRKFPSLSCVVKLPQDILFESDVITGKTIIRDKLIGLANESIERSK